MASFLAVNEAASAQQSSIGLAHEDDLLGQGSRLASGALLAVTSSQQRCILHRMQACGIWRCQLGPEQHAC